MDSLSLLERILLWAVPVILAVTVHETAHGVVAARLGDDTAARAGRLTLNPLRHLDPIGSFVVPGLLLWLSGFTFGWARPVPVDFERLRRPKRDMALVAAAGPLANLVMALAWAVVMKLGLALAGTGSTLGPVLTLMGAAGVFINSSLMMLNLLPMPPLDGGRILVALLPTRIGRGISHIEPWGLPVLVVLIVSGLLGQIIWPMMVVGMAASTWLLDLPVGALTGALRLMLG